MKELEDTYCEIRRITEIQASVWDSLNTSCGDEFGHSVLSPTSKTSEAITLGGFLEDSNYAWLSNGPRFVVVNTKTGDNIASWIFREKVTCVSQFPTQPGEVSLLLIGLDNEANKPKDSAGMVCIFDCSTSRVLRAIRVPAGVEQVCVMNGGAELEEFNEKKAHGILSQSSGIACVVLRNLYHMIIDLRRQLWEGDMPSLSTNEFSPTDIEFSEDRYSSASSRQHCEREKHLAYNLLNTGIEDFIRFNREEFETSPLYDEELTTALIYSKKLGCLISGCLGRIIIWHNDGSVGWISPPAKNNMTISHLALLEPTDDPRPFYYLWVVYQEESFEAAPILRMYALLIERQYCDKEANMDFKIEGEPSVKFELQLDTSDRVTSLVSIERTNHSEQSDTNNKKGEESLLLIGIRGRTLLFDLNQWYKEQMPRNIRDCQNPNTFLSRYQMKSENVNNIVVDDVILDCAYVPLTLREFPSNGGNSSEELFYPKSLCLDWVELTTNNLRIWMTRGLQWELLREMAIAGPSILIQPEETFHRCLAAGLVPFNTECSFDCDQNTQREMLLSLCLEQRWAPFLIKCAKEWGDGSVSYLFPMFLRWGAQRASSLKMVADQLCIPLFDQSGSTIGDTEIKLLRFCSQQLECLSNVVARLPIESNDLIKQQRALRRVATHLGVLLWFYDVGLLPETHEINEETLPITFSLQIPYPYKRLAGIYRTKREQIRANVKNSGDSKEELFIDELMTQECQSLRSQWEREGGDITTGGYYPPPSLQSLLRSYLFDCYQDGGSDEMENKHQITIYLLMDLVKLLQGSCPDVDQLIKYPSAFKMSPSLIKLTQAFWLLDHEDYQGFLDTLTGQLVSDSDVKDWHHKLVIRTLIRNNEYKLALTYLRVRKPPLSAISDQCTSITLSVECGLVQTAFHQRPPSHYRQLLSAFFEACKACGKLNEILQLALDPEEEEAFVKFLEENKSEETRLLYYLQRCRYTEAGSTHQFSLSKSHLKHFQSAPLTMVNAYNATLPNVTKSLSSILSKKYSENDNETGCPRPMSHKRSSNKSQGIFETVLRKVRETYVRGDSCQIPFISAPCTSLKLNSNKTNSSCVLFPILAPKTSGKRTLDEMRENDTRERNSEEIKRRKLSVGSDELDKSSARTLGSSVAFETPLIQRKRLISDRMKNEAETPRSILIRQLLQSSTSPRALTRPPINQREEETLKEQKEQKPARQIRFSIGQPMDDSSHEETPVNTSNETDDKDNASVESEEVFYSPNASGKSQSTDSSYSVTSIRGPRPRPSLRRSCNLSSNESVVESEDPLHKKEFRATPLRYSLNERSTLSATSAGPSPRSTTSVTELGKVIEQKDSLPLHCSLSPITPYSISNESRYSSRILPSDSSFLSTPRVTFDKRKDVSQNESRMTEDRGEKSSQFETSKIYNEVKDYKKEFGGRNLVSVETSKSTTISRSILTRTIITEELREPAEDEEVIVEVDDFGLDHEPEVCFTGDKQREGCLVGHQENNAEESDKRNSFEERNIQNNKESTTATLKMDTEEQRDDNLEKVDEHNSVHSSQDNHESEISDNDDNQPGDIDDNMDDYDAELFALKDKEEEDENAECFQSLTNSAASGMETLPETHESETKIINKELSILSKQFILENSNITEDESSNDVIEENQKTMAKSLSGIINQQLSESYVSRTKALASSTQNQDMTESNFTEDESVSSSIEHFELIADDSDIEEDHNRDVIQGNEDESPNTRNSHRHTFTRNDTVDQIHATSSHGIATRSEDPQASLSQVIENVPSDSRKLDEVKKSKETGDSTSSSESTRNSPQSHSQKRGKVSDNRNKQKSKSPTPVRMTRARRASSAAKEISMLSNPSSSLETSENVVIECPEISVNLVDISHMITSESNNQTQTVRPKRGSKRSASVDKEVLSSSKNEEDVQTNKTEIPLRRSSRRAASAQREMPTIPEVSHDNVKNSKLNSISETDLTNETESTSKKSQRSRKASLTSQDTDVTLPARTRRSSSVAKESIEESQNTSKISTRKRGNSVPKEIGETSRTTRASSLAKDVINEETTKSPVGVKRPKSSLTQSNEELAVNSPAKNTRSRRLFVESILEVEEDEEKEEEVALSARIRERSSSNASESKKASKRGKSRERRAVSLEPSKAEVKKRNRSTLAKTVITEGTVEEESTAEHTAGKSKPAKRTTGRKRTESLTSNPEENAITEKTNIKAGRKTSRSKSGDSDLFTFSPPGVTSDPPSRQQDVEQVPPYVFSPPHTRSKHPAISQLRRKMKNFISPLTMEEKRSSVHPKSGKIVGKDSIPSTAPFASRTLFVHPKRTRKPSTE